MVARMLAAAYAMLGAVERHQVHFGRGGQYVDGAHQIAVHAAGVGNQADTLAFQRGKVVLYQHFKAGFYHRGDRLLFIEVVLRGLAAGSTARKEGQREKYQYTFHN